MLSFKPAFSLSSFTLIKKHFSSSSLSAIRVVSSAYLKSLIFLLVILIPASNSSSLAFHIMDSACKLYKQHDNIQSCPTPFQFLNQSVFPPNVLTIASCPTYRFRRIQVSEETGKMVWYPHLFKRFPQFVVIHTVKGFRVVNKAEVDVFSWNSLAFSITCQILAI